MKKSKLFIAALAIATITLPLVGCSKPSPKNTTVTNSNWYTGTSYKGIQPSFVLDETHPEYTKEVIEYEVTHSASKTENVTYSAEYSNGKFVTEFYAFEYDWKNNKTYPSEQKEILYCYKTTLDISVKFTFKVSGESTQIFADSVKTVSYFRASGKNLQPVYSKQDIISHSPASLRPTSVSTMYSEVNASYETFYNYTCSEGTSYQGETTQVYSNLDKIKYSVFDNSYIYIAARSMKLSDSLSQVVHLVSPISGGTSQYVLTANTSPIDASEDKAEIKRISTELQNNKLFTPSENKEVVPTIGVNINYDGGKLRGTTQTIWFAAIENPDLNTARATMLLLSIPLSYNLGTLTYSLKNIVSTLWNN